MLQYLLQETITAMAVFDLTEVEVTIKDLEVRGGFRYQPYPTQYKHYAGNSYNQYGGGSFRGNSKGFAPMKGRRTVPTATVSSAPNKNRFYPR